MQRSTLETLLFITAAVAALLLSAVAYAAAGTAERCPTACLRYDPASEATVTGKVLEVERRSGERHTGIHLSLATDDGKLEVHLGPEAYLAEMGITVAAGDVLEVVGSTVELDGSEALLARQIRKGDQALVLRDAAGTPEWRGMMAGKRPVR